MHELASVVYPKAPSWWRRQAGWRPHWRSWSKRLAPLLVEVLRHAIDTTRPEKVILGGNSDGATWIHWYATEANKAGIQVDLVIHYAGLWRDHVSPVPAHFYVGAKDPFPTVQATIDAAKAYSTHVQVLAGKHRWNPGENARIHARAQETLAGKS